MTTPLLGLSEIAEGVANQTTIHNMALRQLEALLVRALSKDVAAPPASPAAGDSYIIPAGATGAWSGKENQIAAHIGGAWSYFTVGEGMRLWINDLDAEYVFDGTAWVPNGGGASADIAEAITAHEGAGDPHAQYQKESEKGVANGYAGLGADGKVLSEQLPAATSNAVFGASGANHAPGLVPDPGATAGTTKYLREDGTWSAPAGSSAAPKLTILRRAAAQSVPGGTANGVKVSWETNVQDDVAAFSSSAPTDIVVPAGYTRARVTSYIAWSNTTTQSTGARWNAITKNGTTLRVDERIAQYESASTVVSSWITVAPGDVLGVFVISSYTSAVYIAGTENYPGPSEVQVEWA